MWFIRKIFGIFETTLSVKNFINNVNLIVRWWIFGGFSFEDLTEDFFTSKRFEFDVITAILPESCQFLMMDKSRTSPSWPQSCGGSLRLTVEVVSSVTNL